MVLRGGVRPAALHVDDGRISAIEEYGEVPAGVSLIEAGDLVVLPGLVDTHVHINDPGRSDWEGFEYATRAAAAGGVTTLVDMPLNSVPPTTDVEGLEAKLHAAQGRCHVDVGFWGGVVPGNAAALEPLARHGVLGFKCFLAPSGVDEFPHVREEDLQSALPVLAGLGLPLLVHAELPALLRDPDPASDPREHRTWLASRPAQSENAAIELLTRLGRQHGAHLHIVHLASSGALPALGAARAAGARITVETCPHYLSFAAEDIADGATAFKCAPPIRERAHRERLWDALASGRIDMIATDHSPAPPALKHLSDGNFLRAWGGISSLQLGLSVVWAGASARGISFDSIPTWMAAAPARLAGLDRRKGLIEIGFDADLVIWDPDAEAVVDPRSLQHRHPTTPYAGMPLCGRVRTTLLRGEVVFDEGRVIDSPRGRCVLGRKTPELVSRVDRRNQT